MFLGRDFSVSFAQPFRNLGTPPTLNLFLTCSPHFSPPSLWLFSLLWGSFISACSFIVSTSQSFPWAVSYSTHAPWDIFRYQWCYYGSHNPVPSSEFCSSSRSLCLTAHGDTCWFVAQAPHSPAPNAAGFLYPVLPPPHPINHTTALSVVEDGEGGSLFTSQMPFLSLSPLFPEPLSPRPTLLQPLCYCPTLGPWSCWGQCQSLYRNFFLGPFSTLQ